MTLRVLFVTTSWPLHAGDPGGVFVKRLVDHLPTSCEVSVLLPAAADPTPPECPAHATHLFRYAPMRWQRLAHGPGGIPAALARHPLYLCLLPSFVLSMALHLLWLARRHDVLHANWSVTGCLAAFAGWVVGRPVITTLRGEDIARASRPGVFRWLLQRCLHHNHTVVCVSEAMEHDLRQRFPAARARITHIGNGVGEGFLAIQRVSSYAPTLTLLVVGSLIPRKSVITVLEAIVRLPDTQRPHLLIAGEGEEAAHLRHYVQTMALDGVVEFLGRVPPDSMPGLYARADAFVLASLSEGRPNVLVEAMAAALPVIATAIDGITEMVSDGHSGLLFPAGDSRALAGCLQQLQQDPGLRQTLGKNARQTILDRGLTWSSAGVAYEACYRSACGVV